MSALRFRQVHLDFHTSPDIAGVGARFDRRNWQRTLLDARVNSVTMFALCHHGYSYYDTNVGVRHPQLRFDLLRAQFEACKEVDINVPIYLTAGSNYLKALEHPEWVEVNCEGRTAEPFYAGFRKMCFNSPYLDHLCEQIEEVATLFPDCDGIFMDIIMQGECCCKYCMASMAANELDPQKPEDRKRNARMVLDKYFRMATAAAKRHNPAMSIFHNSGHFSPEWKDTFKYYDHLELESLPTGGWGYDHFPMVAKYCANLKLDFLGMTGKFHTTWGEFGGYKHPDALRYECAAMLAMGAKCSVGDQLHPCGELDASTYRAVGMAYREVEAKEPWCGGAVNIADIGLLTAAGDSPADIGATRLLLEGHFLFEVIDADMELEKYKLLILPDEIAVDVGLKNKIDDFLAKGGKLLLSGASGLNAAKDAFLWDVGAEYLGESEFRPDYALPLPELRADFLDSPVVMYFRSRRIKVTSGKSCGKVHDPYFNRTYRHFCSHQQTPCQLEDSGFDCGALKGGVMYLAHPVFTNYRWYGASVQREYLVRTVRLLLGEGIGFSSNLPSQARANLMAQPEESRYVLHLLYANKALRGGENRDMGDNLHRARFVEVIEALEPLHEVRVSLSLPRRVETVTLEPQGEELAFSLVKGRLEFMVDKFVCHQMVVCHYE